jgi:hypothetical protein
MASHFNQRLKKTHNNIINTAIVFMRSRDFTETITENISNYNGKVLTCYNYYKNEKLVIFH